MSVKTKLLFAIAIFIAIGCVSLVGLFVSNLQLWLPIPSSRIYYNGEVLPEVQLFESVEGDYFIGDRNLFCINDCGNSFVYPRLNRMGIGGQTYQFLGYGFTKTDYSVAMSGTGKFEGRIEQSENKIEMIYPQGKTTRICFDECGD